MIDPKAAAQWDQGVALLAETYPPMLRTFYLALREQGFSDDQALGLTATMLSTLGLASRPKGE